MSVRPRDLRLEGTALREADLGRAHGGVQAQGRLRRPDVLLQARVAVVGLALCLLGATAASAAPPVYRIDRVTDGDTVVLRNGQRVRLVQIDTPEVFFGVECFGRQASAATKRLLPEGSRVRLLPEPATDRVDDFGRLLRYVIRASDGVNVNLRLVAQGAAAPWFYEGRRGRYAARLEALARRAKAKRLGLWGACPRTVYDPYNGIETRR